jgi:hypothetical protein
MARQQDSFRDLVAKAPPAPSEDPIQLVGKLTKSKHKGKFVLILQDGGAVTLNTADVKNYTVLENALWLNLVQVEVDGDRVQTVNLLF